MIKLRFSLTENDNGKEIEIVEGELLKDAVSRALDGIPLGQFKAGDTFNVVVNGHIIEEDFWVFTKLKAADNVTISPKYKDGDSGQLFKQVLIIAVAAVASVYLSPAVGGGIYGALAAGAATLAATLALNALIPPPVPKIADIAGGGDMSSSQMYSVTGQSNEIKRLGIVPKVYGVHRMFPIIAATPYTELGVDPVTKETIQYLVAIYDFGLGTGSVADLKVGDTPLTTDTFQDFQYRLVDINRPGTPEDDIDALFSNEFKLYKGRRETTPLSIGLVDGDSVVQLSDPNNNNEQQEIILDFICPRGLFGYNSNGGLLNRNIRLEIDFALDGTSDWKPYNDPDSVDSFSFVGGTDETQFSLSLANDEGEGTTDFYYRYLQVVDNRDGFWGQSPYYLQSYVRPGQKKLLVRKQTPYDITIGQKVIGGFRYESRYLGNVATVADWPENTDYAVVTLDRNISSDASYYPSYKVPGTPTSVPTNTQNPRSDDSLVDWPFVSWNQNDPQDVVKITFIGHETSAAIITANKTTPVYANVRFMPKVPGQYKVRIKRESAYGPYISQKADDITLGGITSAYTGAPIVTDKRHMFLELKIRATDQLNGNIQNLSGIVSQALSVYDSDISQWVKRFTSNPAWIFCDLLTGEANKKPIDRARLHMDSIIAWADYCDEVPDSPPDHTYEAVRFQCNFVLDYATTIAEVLAQVGGMGQASLNIINGKYGVLVDRFQSTPVQIFTPRNSKDFSSTRTYSPQPHGVKVKYIDPNSNWDVQDAIVYDDGYTEANATEFEELIAFGCTSNEQAFRYGRYAIAQNKLRQEMITITVDFEYLACTRGDYVQITQDVMRVGGTPARVKEIDGSDIVIDDAVDIDPDSNYGYVFRSATAGIVTSTLTPVSSRRFTLDGDLPSVGDLVVIGIVDQIVFDCIVKAISPNDDMSASMTLVEKNNAIFEYESTGVLPEYDPQISTSSRADFFPPAAVENLEVGDQAYECAATLSGYNYFVELLWDMPEDSVFELFEIWVNDGRGYRSMATTNVKYFKYSVDQSRLDIEHGFKVVAVSSSGKKLQLIAMSTVTTTPTTKSTPPSNVSSLEMSITNQVLQLSWQPIVDCDVLQYEIRYSPETNDAWEQSIPLATVAKNVTTFSVQGRTGIYLIKARDFAGNESETAVAAITTIPGLFDLNVIDELNDAPTFEGEFEQVELLGEAVILEEQISGDPDSTLYYSEGIYNYASLFDLGDVYSVRLQSNIRADGLRKGELMSEWEHLEDVEHLNTALASEWNVALQYRATDTFAAMSDWAHLSEIDHINYGAGIGFTDWRDIPTVGDATGRIFQFRTKLQSFSPNVTPRLFDAKVKADMPDRQDSFENLTSHVSEAYQVTYETAFAGPGSSPNVQISIDGGSSGDYWVFENKTLEGFQIRFYDNGDNQVVRQFDVMAKGYGHQHSVTI